MIPDSAIELQGSEIHKNALAGQVPCRYNYKAVKKMQKASLFMPLRPIDLV